MNLDAETLVEALRGSARSEGSIIYINGKADERELSYRELWDRASGLLGYLRSKNIESGDELILFVESNEEFVDVFWASLLGGIIAVPLAIGASDVHIRKLVNVFRKLERPSLYSTARNLRRIEKFCISEGLEREFERIRAATVIAAEISDFPFSAEPADVVPGQTAFIQFSSGSTGDPKGVVLTHRNVMTNVRGILHGVKIRETDSSLSWMPMTHDMGIIGFHIAPLVAAAPLYLMPTELFVRRPMLWLQKISEKRATITASPNFGYNHLLRRFSAEAGELDLSCLRLIFNGAEPISAALCREFSRTLAPFGYREESMFPVYGLAEASLAVTFSVPESPLISVKVCRTGLTPGQPVEMAAEADPRGIELVGVGSAIEGCEVMIADSHDQPAANGVVGSILIRGDNVTAGYYREDALNHWVFKEDGWLDTGDLGFMSGEQLFIAGRNKDLIIVNGQNLHPHDLESICESVGDIDLGRVAALGLSTGADGGEALVIFVLFRGELNDFVATVRKVRRVLNAEAGVDAEYVVPVRAIPKTTSGKIQRYLLAEQFLNGEFDSVIKDLDELMAPSSKGATFAEGGIQDILLQICRSVIDDRDIGAGDNLFELGISSLKLAQLHERIEERFPGRIEVSDLFECPSVRELSEFLDRNQGPGN
ncbi:MAG: non-ribosomal peptide synthetase [Methylococcaceae bacterium]|nr:non-ribosomal peptide synthetase [Methylococcaceae bacterium]MCI0734118.1 non-ribosomal peptide synthetase [Methylococcaceae bacterium]